MANIKGGKYLINLLINFLGVNMNIITEKNEYYYDKTTGLILPQSNIIKNILKIKNWNEKKENEIIILLENKYDRKKISFYYKWLIKYFNFRANIIRKNVSENNNTPSLNKFNIEQHILKEGLSQLILSVTEDCNFRCKYCTFSEEFNNNRNHSLKYMDFETSKKAINIYLKYIKKGIKYNIFRVPVFCFYGGEPLLNFDLIKKSVDYIKSIYDYEVKFNITTNGFLLDKKISDWLINNEFLITVSLDGDQKEHNRKRITQTGETTFNKVFSNVKYILDKKYEKIYVSPVFDYKTHFLNCHEFFKKKLIKVISLSEVDTQYTKKYYNQFNKLDYNTYEKRIIKLLNEYDTNNDNNSYLYHLIEEPIIKWIFESNILSFSRNFVKFTGSCVPSDKIFVSVEGEFYTCERVPPTDISNIGNVNNGLNFNKIIKIIDKFNKKLDKCSTCYMSNFCQKCYKQFIDDIDFKPATDICQNIENEISFFSNALQFMEIHQSNLEKKHIRYEKLYNWRD